MRPGLIVDAQIGDEEMRLQGADGRYDPQDDLLYGSPCLRANCSLPDTRPYASILDDGVDAIFMHFDDQVMSILRRFRFLNSTAVMPAEAISTDDDYLFIFDVEQNDLTQGVRAALQPHSAVCFSLA